MTTQQIETIKNNLTSYINSQTQRLNDLKESQYLFTESAFGLRNYKLASKLTMSIELAKNSLFMCEDEHFKSIFFFELKKVIRRKFNFEVKSDLESNFSELTSIDATIEVYKEIWIVLRDEDDFIDFKFLLSMF